MSAPRCPTCRKPITAASSANAGASAAGANSGPRKWAPFCSERCKLVDLQKWLGGVYAIPGRPVDVSDIVLSKPDASLDDEH